MLLTLSSSLLGPVVGSTLVNPSERFPDVFLKGSIWDRNPYLLPNVVIVLLFALNFILGSCLLKETRPCLDRYKHSWAELRTKVAGLFPYILSRKSTSYIELEQREEDSLPLATSYVVGIPEQGSDELELVPTNKETDPESVRQDSSKPRTFTSQVVLQICSVSLLAFHKVSSDIIIPSFLVYEGRDGFSAGFGFSTIEVGNVLLTQAIVAILAQLLVIPRLIETFGPLRVHRCALCVFPILYCFTPFIVRLPRIVSIVVLLIDLWVKVLLSSLGYVCSAILYVQSCARLKIQMDAPKLINL